MEWAISNYLHQQPIPTMSEGERPIQREIAASPVLNQDARLIV